MLPDALGAELTPVFVMGALISYDRTPVGPYHEVIGIVSARRGRRVVTHVPFIAVDSAASVVGGRANWALPKTLVEFEGEPENDSTMSVHGAGWRIEARPRAIGPRLPFASPPIAALAQVAGDDTVWRLRGSGYGSVRFAARRRRGELRRFTRRLAPVGAVPGGAQHVDDRADGPGPGAALRRSPQTHPKEDGRQWQSALSSPESPVRTVPIWRSCCSARDTRYTA